MTYTWTGSLVQTRVDATGNTFSYAGPTQVSVVVPGQPQPQTFTQYVMTDPRNKTITEHYDAFGRLVHRIDRASKDRWWEYGTDGLLAKLTDENGFTESYGYDAAGNRNTRTDRMGKVWGYTFDSEHRPKTETDPLGNITTYDYDPTADRAWAKIIAPATADQPNVAERTTQTDKTTGRETAFDPGNATPGLMPKGLIRRMIDGSLRTTTFDYDAKGDLRRTTDPAGVVTAFTYDALGRQLTKQVTWTDGAGTVQTATWVTSWTPLSAKNSELSPAVINKAVTPNVTHQLRVDYVYDGPGNLTHVSKVDVNGLDATRTTQSLYDDNDREWKTIDPAGGITLKTFDAFGNVETVTDPLGRRYDTQYSDRNQPIKITLFNYTNPLTPATPATPRVVKTMTYRASGELETETDALGRTVNHKYDANGREYQTELVSYTKPDGTVVSPFVLSYKQFDDAGRITTEQSGNGSARVDRTFDAQNRITTELLTNTGSENRLTTVHYNASSQEVSRDVTCPTTCALTAASGRTVYDPYGRATQRIVENGATDLITVTRYDQLGNVVKVTDPRGTANPTAPLASSTTTTEYDLVGRPWRVTSPATPIDVKGATTTTVAGIVTSGFNTFGETTHSVDPNGNLTASTYDALGRNTQVTHPTYTPAGGTAITPIETFGYDTVGNLTSRIDRLGQTWLFEFDSFNQAVRESAPKPIVGGSNPTTTHAYDLVGNETSTTNPVGATVTATYDNLNRRRTTAQIVRGVAIGETTRTFTTAYDYDSLGNLVSITDPTGALTTRVYSPAGELLTETLPAVGGAGVARTTFTYDLVGRQLTATDPLGRVIANTYDTAGRVLTVDQKASVADGGATLATTDYTYDAASNVSTITSPMGARTRYTFDARNQLRSVIQPVGRPLSAWWKLDETTGTTASDSGPNSAPKHGTLAGAYTLNQPGAVTGVTGSAINFTGGNISIPATTLRKTSRSFSMWFKTSSNGVLLSKNSAASGTVPTSFNPVIYVGTDGKLRAGTTPAAQITTAAAVNNNAWHRVVFDITPDAQILYLDGVKVGSVAAALVSDAWATFAYIATGYTNGYPATNNSWMPFTGLIDDVASAEYPFAGVLAGTTAAGQISLGTSTLTTSYSYDKAGNQTKVVDANNQTWWTTYTPWNQVGTRVEPSATVSPVEAETARTFTTVYNAAGLITSDKQPGGISVDYTYDLLGRVTAQTGVGAPGSKSYTYDANNRRLTATGTAGALTFAYDDRDLIKTSTGAAGASSFVYDEVGRLTSRVDGAGTTNFSYTARGETYATTDPVTSKVVINTYNAASQLTGVNYDNNLATAPTRTYTYNTAGRLASDTNKTGAAVVTASVAYEYDANGNMITKTSGPAATAGVGVNRYSYDQANRLVGWRTPGITDVEYTYDNVGNRTRNGTITSTYDLRNRIRTNGPTTYTWAARGVLATSVIAAVTTNYTFDAFGAMTSTGTAAAPVVMTYDALGRPITRKLGAAAATTFTYSGGSMDPTSDGTATYSRKPGGSPLAVSQAGVKNFLRTDAHGDVNATISTAGAVTASRAFDPFGVVTATGGTGTQPTIGYQSDWTDPTSGLVNMGARWYQPTNATFASRDTFNGRLDTPVSLNRYTYANNNPITYTDPTGRESKGPGTRCEDTGGCRGAGPKQRTCQSDSCSRGGSQDSGRSTRSGNHNDCQADNCDRLRDQIERQNAEAAVIAEVEKHIALLRASKVVDDPLLDLVNLLGVDGIAQAIADNHVTPLPVFTTVPIVIPNIGELLKPVSPPYKPDTQGLAVDATTAALEELGLQLSDSNKVVQGYIIHTTRSQPTLLVETENGLLAVLMGKEKTTAWVEVQRSPTSFSAFADEFSKAAKTAGATFDAYSVYKAAQTAWEKSGDQPTEVRFRQMAEAVGDQGVSIAAAKYGFNAGMAHCPFPDPRAKVVCGVAGGLVATVGADISWQAIKEEMRKVDPAATTCPGWPVRGCTPMDYA